MLQAVHRRLVRKQAIGEYQSGITAEITGDRSPIVESAGRLSLVGATVIEKVAKFLPGVSLDNRQDIKSEAYDEMQQRISRKGER